MFLKEKWIYFSHFAQKNIFLAFFKAKTAVPYFTVVRITASLMHINTLALAGTGPGYNNDELIGLS